MSEETTKKSTMNRAKPYQLVLFPFNNGATNVYYILTITYIAYYGNGVLGLALMFATTMVTVMRLFDAVTDPIIGALIDKTNGRFGKFRPYMVLGNVIMAVSAFLLYFGTRLIPDTMMWLRYTSYVVIYALYVIGYTFQTSCTRSGQTVLTNDPKQRPMFTIQHGGQHAGDGSDPVSGTHFPGEIRRLYHGRIFRHDDSDLGYYLCLIDGACGNRHLGERPAEVFWTGK